MHSTFLKMTRTSCKKKRQRHCFHCLSKNKEYVFFNDDALST